MAAKRFFRRLLKAIVTICLLLAIAVAACKYVVVPAVVASQLHKQMRQYWAGTAGFDGMEFNYSGPSYIRGLKLADDRGRVWLEAGEVKFTLRDWPSMHPALIAIDIDKLRLRAHFTDGNCTLPLVQQPPAAESRTAAPPNAYVDIGRVHVGGISFGALDANGDEISMDNLDLDLSKAGERYAVSLRREHERPRQNLAIDGTIDPCTLRAELSLRFMHIVDAERLQSMLAILGVNMSLRYSGRVSLDAAVTGPLDEPASWHPVGTLRLADLTFSGDNGPIAKNIFGIIELGKQPGLSAEVADFHAVVGEGAVAVRGRFSLGKGNSPQYGGSLIADNVRLPELMTALGQPKEKHSGVAKAKYEFKSDAAAGGFKGHGGVFLDDAQLWNVPIISQIFGFEGLTKDPLTVSDAEIEFTNVGELVTISKGQVANKLSAIQAMPKARIDLKSGKIEELFVVAALMKDLKGFIESIPLVGAIAMNVKDRFTQLKVTGNVYESGSIRVSVSLERNVTAGTLGFFKDMVHSGGQLGGNVFSGFQAVFEFFGGKPAENK